MMTALLTRLWKPIDEYRKTRSDIAAALTLYANVDSGPYAEQARKARERYRQLAATLGAKVDAIPWYPLWSRLKVVPTLANIDIARAELLRLSHRSGAGSTREEALDNAQCRDNIRKALNLRDVS